MTKAAQDFPLTAGDTQYLDVDVTDADGAAVNLNGYTLRWKLNSTPPVVKALGAGITVLDAPGGLVRIALAPADTPGLAGAYEHELEGADADGNVSTLLRGIATINRGLV